MLPTARALADRVAHLGMAALLTGSNRYRLRGVAELKAAARLESWNPSHFLDVAEMASAFAIGLDAFGAILSRRDRAELEDALARLALMPALEPLERGDFWTAATHNWNTICCGGLIAAALAMEATQTALAEAVLARALPSIRCGLSAYGPDGGYPEGPGYWTISTYHAVLALAVLEARGWAAPEHEGLGASWRFHRETTAPSGRCFDFGDTLPEPGRSAVLGWLALATGDPEAAVWQREAPGARHPFDLLWLSPRPAAVPAESVEPSVSIFGSAGVGILRSRSDRGAFYVGLKGGRNDVNHAHRDLGSFVLEWEGRRFVGELGRDDYALPHYFDPDRRHGYFRLSTEGHGVLGVGGRSQAGQANARFVEASPGMAVEIEDETSLVEHRRRVLAGKDGIWISDEVARKHPSGDPIILDWRVYTPAAVTCQAGVCELVLDACRLFLRIVGTDAEWCAAPAASPPGEGDNSAFTRLGFSVVLAGPETRFAVEICDRPGAGDQRMPPEIAAWGLRVGGTNHGA